MVICFFIVVTSQDIERFSLALHNNGPLVLDDISLVVKLENFHWHLYIIGRQNLSLAVQNLSLAEYILFRGQFNMPTVLDTANERVISNERF